MGQQKQTVSFVVLHLKHFRFMVHPAESHVGHTRKYRCLFSIPFVPWKSCFLWGSGHIATEERHRYSSPRIINMRFSRMNQKLAFVGPCLKKPSFATSKKNVLSPH